MARAFSFLGVVASAFVFAASASAGVTGIPSVGPAVGATPTAPAPRANNLAAPAWHDGLFAYGPSVDCVTGGAPAGEAAYVGWYGDIAGLQVNQVYYVRAGWAQLVSPCTGGSYVHFELGIPAGTDLAISASTPVRCFYQSPSATQFTETPNGCPQTPGIGIYGGATFDPAHQWATAFGSQYQVWVPLVSHQPLSGIDGAPPCPQCIYGGIWFIDGIFSPWVFPHQGVYVVPGSAPAVPAVSYPVPSFKDIAYVNPTYNLTTLGYLYAAGTTGSAYAQIGDAGGAAGTYTYTTPTAPVNVSNSFTVSWTGVDPGTSHWRACYAPSGGSAVCGSDQQFTVVPPSTTLPDTSIVSGPSGSTQATNASFQLATTKLGATFECSLDGATFKGCTDPTYNGLGLGAHNFQARAKDAVGVDLTPAARAWTIVAALPPPPPPVPPPPAPPAVKKCVVPKVVGKTLAAAKAAINKGHCATGRVKTWRSKKRKGLVISQTPLPGKRLKAGSKVNLVVSRGKR